MLETRKQSIEQVASVSKSVTVSVNLALTATQLSGSSFEERGAEGWG